MKRERIGQYFANPFGQRRRIKEWDKHASSTILDHFPDRSGIAADSPHRLVAQTQARYLIAVAENDDTKEPETKNTLLAAFDSAKLSPEVEVYPAAHRWCPPDTRVYDAAQSERAWTRLLATFSQTLV